MSVSGDGGNLFYPHISPSFSAKLGNLEIQWRGRRTAYQYYQSRKGLSFSCSPQLQLPFLVAVVREAMVLENVLSSPRRKSPSFRRQFQRDELGSWQTLFHRHRFLLTALVLLTFLCTIYLYFAVTIGATMGSCSGLLGARKVRCQLEMANKGKLKFL